jgi:hypothetical protein
LQEKRKQEKATERFEKRAKNLAEEKDAAVDLVDPLRTALYGQLRVKTQPSKIYPNLFRYGRAPQ